ncbi:MAPEG family protein [Novosphingobium beihaiensis]|uniref:MAPEG family protein n=1 Tax=Novosphingobium beihaiensis TaxID=2930389 RepID=A0ABT0BM90_9SPHN|nr:MAPEG family protein [Novosphingobium beihaiensis]MCJ2186144.1 MAPEG family protein [Novosphingobium beihaiensis]
MILQTTLSLAAAAAVMNIWLGMRTGKLRYNAKILHGDGGHPLLMQRMRAQANFIENTPFVLILTAAIEMTGKGGTWLAIAGSVYLLARISHAFGMDRTDTNPLRAIGFLITVLTLIGLSAVAVLISLGQF